MNKAMRQRDLFLSEKSAHRGEKTAVSDFVGHDNLVV
jgi:hypothetical protein